MNEKKQYRIMLVDDDVSTLNSLRRTLRDNNYIFESYSSPIDALERVKHIEFDIIISDYRMPQMDGVTLVKRIREYNPKIIGIMLSGFTHLGAVLGAINEAEIFRYITKPWNGEDLKNIVKQAISRKEISHRSDMRSEKHNYPEQKISRNGCLSLLEEKYPGITSGAWDSYDEKNSRW